MPCVKRLHQESENSSKAEYIFGHMFGCIGVLVGSGEKMFCLPLSASLHDGDKLIRQWDNEEHDPVSHVVQTVRDAFSAAKILGDSILLLDAYYFTIPLLKEIAQQATQLDRQLSIVTRAKMATVAYKLPLLHSGRGRPRKKGEAVKLKQLFDAEKEHFTKATVCLYGKEEAVEYLCVDLLWGQGLYQLIRFVLVKSGDAKLILACTDVSFTPLQILSLYGYRFKIEVTFRTLKQLIGAFMYRFWSMSMPKLNRFAKKGEDDPLLKVECEKERKQILSTFSATEGFVMLSLIANGILQLLSLKYSSIVGKSSFCWLRRSSGNIVSELTMSRFLRRDIFMQFHKQAHLAILQIIRSKMESGNDADLPGAA